MEIRANPISRWQDLSDVDLNDFSSGQVAVWNGSGLVGSDFVSSFNGRDGDVELESGDVTDALGYTPASAAAVVSSFNTRQGAVSLTSLDVTTALGFTPVTQAYVDSAVVGLLDDRGSFDASGNVFPSTGGSGSAGAIKKGDLWFISVAGTLGGSPVSIGDSIRALADSPGQTASNWAILEANVGYVPENVANKATSFSTLNNTLYPSVQAVANYAQPLDPTLTALAAFNSNGLLAQTAADTFAARTITGTANQVNVLQGDGVSGNPTLSLPQSIHTGASPQFSALGLGATAPASGLAIGSVNLVEDATNALAQRNGATAQSFFIYSTFTDASNYERLGFEFLSNTFKIRSENAGTGTARGLHLATVGTGTIRLVTNDTARWRINGSTGNIEAEVDNTYSVGSTTLRPSIVFAAQSVSIGTTSTSNALNVTGNSLLTGTLAVTGTGSYGGALTVTSGNVILDNTRAYSIKDNPAGAAISVLGLSSANNLTISTSTASGSIQINVPNAAGRIGFFTGSSLTEKAHVSNAGLFVLGTSAGAATSPALKASSTALQFKLGDDSAFTSAEANSLTIGAGTAIASTNTMTLFASSESTKPFFRYLSTGTGTGKWQYSNDGSTAIDIGGNGAHRELNNLQSVAINTSLISDTDNTDDLGSSSIKWKDGYFAGTVFANLVKVNGIYWMQSGAVGSTLVAIAGDFDTYRSVGLASVKFGVSESDPPTVGIQRVPSSVNALEINNLTAGQYRDLKLRRLILTDDTTGAGMVLGFGSNCPASTLTAPYTWLKMESSDGSTVYVPAYK